MYRKASAYVLVAGLCVCALGSLAAKGKDSDPPSVAGTAIGIDQRPLIDYLVRLRSLDTARAVATTRTSATGEYAFRGVAAGRYGIEILDAANKIVGTAGPFIVSPTKGTGRSRAALVMVGATTAAIAALFGNTSTTRTSPDGTAGEMAEAANAAGITGAGVSGTMKLPSRPK
jgi:hypothetical protein